MRFRVEAGGEEALGSDAAVRALAERVASLEKLEIAGHRVVGAVEWARRLPSSQRAVRIGFELLPRYDHPPQAEIHQRRADAAFAALHDAHRREEPVRVRLGDRGSRLQAFEVLKVAQMERRVVVGFAVEPPQRPAEVPLEELSLIALRRELRRRKVGQLRRLAAEVGCSDDEIRSAFEDDDDPKGAVVALLFDHYARLGGHALEEPAPELSVPTLVRVKVVEGRQLKAAVPFNLSRHRDHDAYVEVQLLAKNARSIPNGSTSAALNAFAAAGADHSTIAPLRGHVSDFGGAEISNKPRQQELTEMRLFALQQICKDMGLDTMLGTGEKAELVSRILEAEAETPAKSEDRAGDAKLGSSSSGGGGGGHDSQRRQREVGHGRPASDERSRERGDRTRRGDDIGQSDGALLLDPRTARYSATTFRRSAAWKSTIVHQTADPVRYTDSIQLARERPHPDDVVACHSACSVAAVCLGLRRATEHCHSPMRDRRCGTRLRNFGRESSTRCQQSENSALSARSLIRHKVTRYHASFLLR